MVSSLPAGPSLSGLTLKVACPGSQCSTERLPDRPAVAEAHVRPRVWRLDQKPDGSEYWFFEDRSLRSGTAGAAVELGDAWVTHGSELVERKVFFLFFRATLYFV